MSYADSEIRRLYIDDEQWNRTSSSWKHLEPKKNFNCFDENDETIFEYCERVAEVIATPENVAEQWLYCHYYNGHTVDNYGWIDYKNSLFEYTAISIEEVINLKVINAYLHYVQSRMKGIPFKDFMCVPQDKKHWIQERTWRIPPVIVDVTSFPNPPSYSDFSGSYQLIEGHSRLGYLLSMHRAGEQLKEEHHVYILRAQKFT